MSKHRLLQLGLLASVLFLYGCPAPPPPPPPKPVAAAPKAPTAEALKEVAKADINPANLPPPRAPLANSPDLSGATYVVNDATLSGMAAGGVPAAVVDQLKKLNGKSFVNATDFMAAVKDAVGQQAATDNQDQILRRALSVTLADAPVGPKGQASLDEAMARSQAGAMMTTQVAPEPVAMEYRNVYFDFDKSVIKPEFVSVIKDNARTLLQNKKNVTIEGHCDERGTVAYNLALGQRRAEAVLKALQAEGVSSSQLKTISYGKERPVDPGHNEEAWAKNRRSVLVEK